MPVGLDFFNNKYLFLYNTLTIRAIQTRYVEDISHFIYLFSVCRVLFSSIKQRKLIEFK